MADIKKPQPFPIKQPSPPNRPAGTAVLEPNEEPPLRPPTSKITYGQPKHEIQLYGGPRDGEVVDYKEARKYLGQGYGYIELPEKRITSAQPQPGESGQQPPHKPGEHWIQVPFGPDRGKWVRESEYAQKYGPLPQTQRQPITPPTTGVKTRLAQPTEPLPTPEKPEIISPYSREDQIIIDGWKKVEEQLPPGPKKSTAQNFLQKAQLQGKKNYEEKSGPVPVENLSIIKKMVGEFKDFYYQGYAKVVEKAKEKAGEQAWGAEYSQKQAIQYGMSSLIDLHRGLDLASWHFFFKILGPLGSVLENYHEHKIGWDMAYYGRAWWSPYRIDYLIKTLPEQKAFDITYDTLRNTIYYVNKIAGSPIFSKTATYDRFGRKVTKDFIVFTPLLKMQKGLNTVSILADNLSKRNTYQISLAFQKYQDAKKKFPKSSPEFKKAKDDWITFKNDNGDRIRNKLARFFGLRSVAKNIRETRRDPLSFLAILIGEWLFDITVGNLFRATIGSLAERLAASKLGVAAQEFFSGKYMTAGKMVGSGLVDAGRAVFSVNTLGGGLIGYQIGGVPGAILGSGGGWFWQVVRNFGLDTTRMAWTQRYLDFLKDEKYFGGKFTTREFILGPKLELQPTWVKFFNIKFNIAGRSWYPFRGMLTPGPISRFANWLNTGELKIGGFKIPIGQLVKPIPSVFINGTLIRWYVSPVLTQLGIQLGWSPQLIGIINSPVFQYGIPALWEYRPLIGNLWGNFLQRFLYTGESFGFLPGEYQFVRMGGGPGVGYIFNKAGTYVVFENEGGTAFQAAKTTGFYKNILQIRSGIWEAYQQNIGQPVYRVWQTFLEEHQSFAKFWQEAGKFNKVGLTNFSGFIIGWEIASLAGVNPLVGGLIGWFGINTGLFITYKVADVIFGNLFGYNLLPGFFTRFVGLFNTGFWLGTGVQGLFSLFGINIPLITPIVTSWWFPLATSGVFSLSPLLLQGVAFVISGVAPTAAAFLTSFAAGITAGAGGLAALSVTIGITSVAALAVFSIIIIGSAFWVPVQETLRGITSESPCFSLNTPNAIFTAAPGDKKDLCGNLVIKPDTVFNDKTVMESVSLDPSKWQFANDGSPLFTVTKIVNGISTDITGSVLVKPSIGNVDAATANRILNNSFGRPTQLAFSLPLDKSLTKQEYAQQTNFIQTINSIRDELKNYQNPNNAIIINNLQKGTQTDVLNPFLQNEQNMLNGHKNDTLEQRTTLLNQQNTNVNNQINDIQQQKKTALFTNGCAGTTASTGYFCQQVASVFDQRISGLQTEWSAFSTIFSQDSITDSAYNAAAADLDTKIKQTAAAGQNIDTQNKIIDHIKNNPLPQDAQTGQPQQQALDADNQKIVNEVVPADALWTAEPGTTYRVCLHMVYTGKPDEQTNITFSGAAPIPINPLIQSINCQVSSNIPVNPVGKENWPVANHTCSRGYNTTKGKDYHLGIDTCTPSNSSVTAVADGQIVDFNYNRDFGCYMILGHANGLYSLYAHLSGDGFGNCNWPNGTFLNAGVKAGQEIAKSDNTGNSTGPHLHFAMGTCRSTDGFYSNPSCAVDPCRYIGCNTNSGCNYGEVPKCGNP